MKINFFLIFFIACFISVLTEESRKKLFKTTEKRTRLKNIQAQQPIDYDDYYEETNSDIESNEEIEINGLFH